MRYRILITICFFLTITSLTAQEKMPVAGIDTSAYHPVFIQSRDGKFKLNLGLYTQFRYNANFRQTTPEDVESFTRGYNMARTRLFFEGNYTDKFYYHMRTNINPSGNFEFFVAYLQYNIKNNMWVRMGRQFMALGREDWMYPQDLASIEFSAHDFTYAIWSNFGFQFHHRPSDKFRYWVGIGNGAYGGRRQFPDPKDSDFTLTGRVDYNILGTNWGVWDDMISRKGTDFGMLLGFGAGYTKRSDEEALLTDAEHAYQLNLDYSIAGDGFHFFIHGSYTGRSFKYSDENISGGGLYSTFGYWLNKYWFPYVRFDFIGKGENSGFTENYASPGIGISYYPFKWSNRYRFTLEYNYLGATVNNTPVEPDGQLGLVESDWGSQQSIRLQVQFGF